MVCSPTHKVETPGRSGVSTECLGVPSRFAQPSEELNQWRKPVAAGRRWEESVDCLLTEVWTTVCGSGGDSRKTWSHFQKLYRHKSRSLLPSNDKDSLDLFSPAKSPSEALLELQASALQSVILYNRVEQCRYLQLLTMLGFLHLHYITLKRNFQREADFQTAQSSKYVLP